jgi:hypothetical protein
MPLHHGLFSLFDETLNQVHNETEDACFSGKLTQKQYARLDSILKSDAFSMKEATEKFISKRTMQDYSVAPRNLVSQTESFHTAFAELLYLARPLVYCNTC